MSLSSLNLSTPVFLRFRTLWKSAGPLNRNWRYGESNPRTPSVPGEANLVGSLLEGDTGYHMPVIDLDFDTHLEPSSTPGHFHLYLNRAISWEKYQALLEALYKAGIIEEGFYEMSIARGQSFVRYPGVKKLPGEEASG